MAAAGGAGAGAGTSGGGAGAAAGGGGGGGGHGRFLHFSPDPSGQRTGDAPSPELAEVLNKTCDEAAAVIAKTQVDRNVCLTQSMIQEKLDNIRGAVTMGTARPLHIPLHLLGALKGAHTSRCCIHWCPPRVAHGALCAPFHPLAHVCVPPPPTTPPPPPPQRSSLPHGLARVRCHPRHY